MSHQRTTCKAAMKLKFVRTPMTLLETEMLMSLADILVIFFLYF